MKMRLPGARLARPLGYLLRRRLLLGTLAGVVVFGTVFAFAATLSVSTNNLSAGNASVTSCDTDGVTATYGVAYDSSLPGYKVSQVTVTGIASACNGKTVAATLVDSSNNPLGGGSMSGTFSSAGSNTQIGLTPSATLSAASVANVHVAING